MVVEVIIQHSVSATNNLFQQMKKRSSLNKELEKLSSGYRINRASDDTAGLQISEGMRAQIRGLQKGMKNTMDGISLLQVVDGALAGVQHHLLRMRELAVEAANDTLTDEDRGVLQLEIEQLKQGIDQIANDTEFNTIKLLNKNDAWTETNTVTTTMPVTIFTPFSTSSVISSGNISVGAVLNFSTVIPKGTTFVRFTAAFNRNTSSNFPDLNVTSSNGERFGFSQPSTTLLNSGTSIQNTTNTSSTKATYTGYTPLTEIYTFENPVLGAWDFQVFNDKGTTMANYNFTVDLVGVTETITYVNTTTINTITHEGNANLIFQTGANEGQALMVQLPNVLCEKIGAELIDISTRQGADQALGQIDRAVQYISSEQSIYGAYMNRLEYTYKNSANYQENLIISESRIRDTDMAQTYSSFVKEQILLQASNTMLATININHQRVLNLLS